MYMILSLTKTVQVSVLGQEIKMPLSYADGMIGAIAVFDKKESAEAFAGDRFEIQEITIKGD